MPLYLVATPLGNLADLSARACDVLRAAPVLAAEDTRSARRLLSALQIPLAGRELVSYGEHNEREMAPRLAERLRAGQDVALLSEGGTPLISDPGYRLVRAAIEAAVAVVPVPGPCAAVAALSASGLPVHGFLFRGFPPKKPGARRRLLEDLRTRGETLVFYESPQRVARTLAEFAEVFGAERPACVARELTKVHESFWRGTLGELAARAVEEEEAGRLRGEFTLLVAGASGEDEDGEPDE
jgi:16S rRNA (cytidine1402-2'-O)-methyltransferase